MSCEETASKKRKSEDLSNDSTLLEVLGHIKNATKIYSGLSNYLSSMSPENEIYRLAKASYVHDITAQGCYVVPELLRRFVCKRDTGTDKISSISDQQSVAKGKSLARLLTVERLKREGYDTFIFADIDTHDSSCLALSSEWQLEKDIVSKKREHVECVYKLYHANGFNRMYIPCSLLKQILSYDYITLKGVGTVVSTLNNYYERVDIATSGLKDISDLDKLVGYCSANDDLGKLEEKFLSALLACASASSSLARRSEIFVKAPSARLARSLNLVKPYTTYLCDRTTNGGQAPRVTLGSLDANALVQMSTVAVDTKFYDSVTGNPESWTVYEASDNLCVKRKVRNKVSLEALTGQPTLKASSLLAMMKAIAKQNARETSTTTTQGVIGDNSGDLEEIDF